MSDAGVRDAGGRSSTGRIEKWAAVAAAFLGLMAGFPSSYLATSTTFILPLTEAFGWGRLVPSMMYLCSMGGIATASIWLGRVIERFGDGRVALVSGLCLAGALAALGAQTGAPIMAFAICLFAGVLGAGTSVGLYLTALPRWFEADLGKALGFSIVGMSVGVTLMPALASSVSLAHGWRAAYFTLAAVQLALTCIAAMLLLWLRCRRRSSPQALASAAQFGLTLAQALRTRTFWLLAAMVFLATLSVFGPAFHIFPLYADREAPRASLPTVAVMLGVGTLLGRLGSGFLLDHVDARIIAGATFALGAAGLLWLAIVGEVRSPLSLCGPPILLGAALGAESDIIAYMARRFFGLRHHAAIYNRILLIYYLGAVSGPLALGWAFDSLGRSAEVLTAVAICCAAASVIAALLPRPDASAEHDPQPGPVAAQGER